MISEYNYLVNQKRKAWNALLSAIEVRNAGGLDDEGLKIQELTAFDNFIEIAANLTAFEKAEFDI